MAAVAAVVARLLVVMVVAVWVIIVNKVRKKIEKKNIPGLNTHLHIEPLPLFPSPALSFAPQCHLKPEK